MNCEKCKNKKATLFYADELGGRHALCAACGAMQGKLGTLHPTEEAPETATVYIPDLTLTALLCGEEPMPLAIDSDLPSLICGRCKLTLDELKKGGHVGCPDCYEVFGDLLFPVLPHSRLDLRMPASRRKAIERRKAIAELREQIDCAIQNENYELAATLRDKIKSIEHS